MDNALQRILQMEVYKKAEPPCNKGEIDIPIWKWNLVIVDGSKD